MGPRYRTQIIFASAISFFGRQMFYFLVSLVFLFLQLLRHRRRESQIEKTDSPKNENLENIESAMMIDEGSEISQNPEETTFDETNH